MTSARSLSDSSSILARMSVTSSRCEWHPVWRRYRDRNNPGPTAHQRAPVPSRLRGTVLQEYVRGTFVYGRLPGQVGADQGGAGLAGQRSRREGGVAPPVDRSQQGPVVTAGAVRERGEVRVRIEAAGEESGAQIPVQEPQHFYPVRIHSNYSHPLQGCGSSPPPHAPPANHSRR